MTIERTKVHKPMPPNNELVFGKYTTDHMFEVDWDANNGWSKPAIVPYHNLCLDPASSVFHYALEVFFFFTSLSISIPVPNTPLTVVFRRTESLQG